MEEVRWDDTLSVGVNLIDEQHKALIQRLNEVSAAVEKCQGPREVAKTLGFLSEYGDFHFATEEKHMQASGYPELENHKIKHQEFRDMVTELERDFEEEGSTQTLAQSINTLLGNWLLEHIRRVDHEFGAFLDEQGIMIGE